MSKSKDKKQVTAKCVFCNRPGVDHQHIWPMWVRKVFGKQKDRVQAIMVGGTLQNPIYKHRKFQGGIHTKTARRVCPKCNRGWMRDIELAAELVGTRLINGERTYLDRDQQIALAKFIFQSALMIDLVGQSPNRFPKSDFEYFYTNKIPPPHWYVGIGYYQNTGHYPPGPAHAVDYSPQGVVLEEKRKIIIYSISTILNHLFTSTQATNPVGTKAFTEWPTSINGPHLTPIWPYLNQTIRFPTFMTITGGLNHGGGLARELSLRFPTAAMELIARTGNLP